MDSNSWSYLIIYPTEATTAHVFSVPSGPSALLQPVVTLNALPPQDYSVPEISLFPEENAEGKKVVFRDTSDDARIFGFPVKATSIIINAGL